MHKSRIPLRSYKGVEAMFVFAIIAAPSSTSREADIKLLKKYKEFSDVFDKMKANTLPEHRPYDCPIDLQLGKEPPWDTIYILSPVELETLLEYIDENLANEFIRHSRSPAGAPIFFVKKKNDNSHSGGSIYQNGTFLAMYKVDY